MKHTVIVGERANLGTQLDGWSQERLDRLDRAHLRRPSMFAFTRGYLVSERLAALGLRWDTAVNLLPPRWQGCEWDAEMAKRNALAFTRTWLEHRLIVLLGRKVQTAFGYVDTDPASLLIDTGDSGHDVLLLPHPSGLCRWWNSRTNVEYARRLVEKAMNE
jgi:hypothetical protein